MDPDWEKEGQTKEHWQRTVMTGLSWHETEAKAKARDKVQWHPMIAALCPNWDEEGK